MTPNWEIFIAVRTRLIASSKFEPSKQIHKLYHLGAVRTEVDIIPFGGLESASREIIWPPENAFVMNVLGLQEARRGAHGVVLPNGVVTNVISLPSMILLKFAAWKDRRLQPPLGKDASDIRTLFFEYLAAGNFERVFEVRPELATADEFKLEVVSAWLLGHDARRLLSECDASEDTIRRFSELIRVEVVSGIESRLISDMRSTTAAVDLACLEHFYLGFSYAAQSKK